MGGHWPKVSHMVGQQIVTPRFLSSVGSPVRAREARLKMALSSSVPGPEIGVVFMLYKFIIKSILNSTGATYLVQ